MGRIDVSVANGIREPGQGRYMVAGVEQRSSSLSRRDEGGNPGKDAKYIGTPFRGGIMRGFNIYTCFSCNALDDKRTTI